MPDGRGVLLMCIQQNKCPFFSLLRILVALSKPTNMKPITIDGIAITPCPKTSFPYNPKFIERAKALRYAQNLPEVLFWMQVTNGRFHQLDFDRQRIIGNYIVDFYIKQLGLVIAIDGES